MVRYGDDFCVLAATRTDAQEGLHLVEHAAAEIGMRLSTDSSVMSFTDGFCFLGEDFGPRYPPVLDDRIVEPATRTDYVAKPGAFVRTEAGRLIVETTDDVELLNVPTGHVERLVLFGPVGLSAGARSWALASDVEVIIASRRGHYLGQLSSGSTRRVTRLRAQLACADDPDRAIPFGRAAIDAKIRKQIVLIQRITRRDNHEDLAASVDAMRRMLALLPDAATRDEIMGVEGAAARAYFTALSLAVPEPLRFTSRSRRPPLDLVNAALSYGYTLLTGEAVAALTAAGLDPAIGLLHTDTDRRPSLALDLIEEFRPSSSTKPSPPSPAPTNSAPNTPAPKTAAPASCSPKPAAPPSSTPTNTACSTPPEERSPASPAASAATSTAKPNASPPTSTTAPREPAYHGGDPPCPPSSSPMTSPPTPPAPAPPPPSKPGATASNAASSSVPSTPTTSTTSLNNSANSSTPAPTPSTSSPSAEPAGTASPRSAKPPSNPIPSTGQSHRNRQKH
ncbi:CRISPR-associated endonuclease Cas1 [Micromonospora sp. WMMD734]|uniref:CRISPR-associated endonuclease Cas1 n=1 Tax=Micromonospora sp. WMMD734 TaxID=3404129 RepID=UPI003BA00FF3